MTDRNLPIICNMDVFTPAEREEHIQEAAHLFGMVRHIHDVERGYEFIFSGTEYLSRLAGFISKEKKCCPFLEFTIKIAPKYETTSLLLTGPEGTQEFLREEFSEAFK